jgi:hypothetical protein
MDDAKLTSSLQQIKALADECLASLDDSTKPKRATRKPPPSSRAPELLSIDFDKPLRPFIKKYAKGMSGTEKFVLLLSRLAKGELKQEVAIEDIQEHWNKMKAKSLLGLDFNTFYSTNAKDNDWVETKKRGFYNLRPSWKDIFQKHQWLAIRSKNS